MDERIEALASEGTEFLTDYTRTLLGAVSKFTERLLTDVATLTAGVIEESVNVARAATESFLPKDEGGAA